MNNLRNEQLLQEFGAHIKKVRLSQGMTQESLAYACDMELSQVYRIEKGKVNATISTIVVLAKGLNTTVAELLKGF